MNIGIIGLGLIGGSLGKSFVEKTAYKVFGKDISNDVVLQAISDKAIHEVLGEKDLANLDIAIIALTPRKIQAIMSDIIAKLKPGSLAIDACGIKSLSTQIMANFAKNYPEIQFISTHPMAGREVSGIKNSTPDLFRGASMILTPISASTDATSKLTDIFREIGFSKIFHSDTDEHDSMIAYTSQLPHIISSCYIQNEKALRHNGFSAGSFLDLSRVAKMNVGMWTELIFENREKMVPELDLLIRNLSAFRQALATSDEPRLAELFQAGDIMKRRVDNAED